MINFIRTFDHDLPLPARGTPASAGLDICAAEDVTLHPGKVTLVSTGWSWDASQTFGIYGRIAPRSGLTVKHGVDTKAGVIDADYQGEIKVPMTMLVDEPYKIKKGDRIAQLILEHHMPTMNIREADSHAAESERGEGGFGSTGS